MSFTADREARERREDAAAWLELRSIKRRLLADEIARYALRQVGYPISPGASYRDFLRVYPYDNDMLCKAISYARAYLDARKEPQS